MHLRSKLKLFVLLLVIIALYLIFIQQDSGGKKNVKLNLESQFQAKLISNHGRDSNGGLPETLAANARFDSNLQRILDAPPERRVEMRALFAQESAADVTQWLFERLTSESDSKARLHLNAIFLELNAELILSALLDGANKSDDYETVIYISSAIASVRNEQSKLAILDLTSWDYTRFGEGKKEVEMALELNARDIFTEDDVDFLVEYQKTHKLTPLQRRILLNLEKSWNHEPLGTQ
jgi:hypothetical protein